MEREFSGKVIATPTHGVEPSGEVWAGDVAFVDYDNSIDRKNGRNNPPKHTKKKEGREEKAEAEEGKKEEKEKEIESEPSSL